MGVVFGAPGLVQVRNSAQVTLDACNFSVVSSGSEPPTPGLLLEDSEVHVNGCTIVGGSPAIPFGAAGVFDGAPGIRATNSLVRLSRSEVGGGRGTLPSIFFTPTVVTVGGAAVDAANSRIYVRGGSGNSLQGGAGGIAVVVGQTMYGSGGPALQVSIGSLATTTPDAVAAPGADGDGAVTTPVVAGPGVWTQLPEALASLESTAKLVAPGGSVTFELGGEPGALFLTYISIGQAAAVTVPGIPGVIVLAPGVVGPLGSAVLDGAGQAGFNIPIPPLPGLVGLTVLAQGFARAPSGQASFSAPTFIGVR